MISPGKSWEGFFGGTVAAVAVAFFALYDQDVVTTGESLVLGLVIGVAATLGDLFESAVKRDLGVKDSGACSRVTAACSTGSTRCSGPALLRTSRSSP